MMGKIEGEGVKNETESGVRLRRVREACADSALSRVTSNDEQP